MKVVLVSEALLTGGAETFVLRLGRALAERGHSVSVFVLRADLIDRALVRSVAPELNIQAARIWALRWLLRLDGLLYRLGLSISLVRWLQVRALRRRLRATHADIAHSHLFTADVVTARACQAEAMPWVTTMHGDYVALESRGASRAARIISFHDALREVERSVGHLVAITDHQREQLRRLLRGAARERTSKIYNGYEAAALKADEPHDPLPQVPSGAFVVGMVARGIEEKGWDVLLAAFERAALPDAWLVLVGDGKYLRGLRARTQQPRVVFVGNVVNPLRYIARFDVACLPTRFPAESLPTVVIEYLVAGKPVVATDIGEIACMLEAGTRCEAGILLPQEPVEAVTDTLAQALRRLHDAPEERERLQANARKAAAKFQMRPCVDAYLGVYRGAMT